MKNILILALLVFAGWLVWMMMRQRQPVMVAPQSNPVVALIDAVARTLPFFVSRDVVTSHGSAPFDPDGTLPLQ